MDITPTRKPLFAHEEKLEQRVEVKPTFIKQEYKPMAPVSTFVNKRLLLSFGLIFVAVVIIVVLVLTSQLFTQEVVQKSSILIPFLFTDKLLK